LFAAAAMLGTVLTHLHQFGLQSVADLGFCRIATLMGTAVDQQSVVVCIADETIWALVWCGLRSCGISPTLSFLANNSRGNKTRMAAL